MRLLRILVLVAALTLAAAAQDPMLDAANAYLQAFAKATSWNDVIPYVTSESVAAIKSLPAEDRDRIFLFYQKYQQAAAGDGPLALKDRQVDGDRARLVLQLANAKPTDDFQGQNILLKREGEAWKVDIAKLIRAMGS